MIPDTSTQQAYQEAADARRAGRLTVGLIIAFGAILSICGCSLSAVHIL